MTEIFKASRIADEGIYLSESRGVETKKYFVEIADYIEARVGETPFRLLDVGCAAGDLFAYLKTRFVNADLTGIEISQKLFEAAAQRFPDAKVLRADVASEGGLPVSSMDFVTISGVLNCLDDPEQAIRNLIGAVRSGGTVIIWDLFNPHPIDVIVRHRRVSDGSLGPWETGWNSFSLAYISRILNENERVADFHFERFSLGKSVPQREDPMRTWTVDHDGDPYQMVTGMGQLVHHYFLFVETH